MLFLTVGVSDLSVQVLVLLLDLLSKGFHLLLFVPVLILDEGQFTLHLHAVVDVPGQITFVLLLDFFNLVPGLVFNALTLLSVAFIHLLDLQRQGLLLSFLFFSLKHLVTITVLHQALVSLIGLAHQLLKLLEIFLLLLEQAFITISIGRTLLLLILLLLLELVVVLVAMPLELLAIGVARLATRNLYIFHASVAFNLLFFHIARQIFLALLVTGEKGGMLFRTIALLSLDRLFEIANLMLKLISLLLLDEDLLTVGRVITPFLKLVDDLEDAEGTILTR